MISWPKRSFSLSAGSDLVTLRICMQTIAEKDFAQPRLNLIRNQAQL